MRQSRDWKWVSGIVVFALIWASPSLAQGKRPMTLVDLLEVPSLSDPQLSPDGQQLLYVLAEADWEANKRISHIWRVQTGGSGLVQLTNGVEGESSRELVRFVLKSLGFVSCVDAIVESVTSTTLGELLPIA